MLTAWELKEQAASYHAQAAQEKQLAGLSKEEQDRMRLLEHVQELEEEASFFEELAAGRETNRQ